MSKIAGKGDMKAMPSLHQTGEYELAWIMTAEFQD
jgi:hypothetical protein